MISRASVLTIGVADLRSRLPFIGMVSVCSRRESSAANWNIGVAQECEDGKYADPLPDVIHLFFSNQKKRWSQKKYRSG